MRQTKYRVTVEWREDGMVSSDQPAGLLGIIAAEHARAFRAVAESMGFEILSYRDEAIGYVRFNDVGRMILTAALLQPSVTYGSVRATPAEEMRLHELAKEQMGCVGGSITHIHTLRMP